MKRYKQLFNEDRYEDTLRKSSFFSRYNGKIIPTKTYQEFQHSNKQIIKQYVDEEKEKLNDIPDVSKRNKKLKDMMREIGIELTDVWSALKNELHEHWVDIKFSDIEKLEEELHLADFKKHAGASDFTKDWIEIRRKIKGPGNKSAKLHSLKINRKEDYVIFVFKSSPTYSGLEKSVNVKSMTWNGKVKAYTEMIKINDFFKLAETKPGYVEKEMNWKEIKEILSVAPISVSCNCGSFTYQGLSYYLTQLDGTIFPNNIEPKRWNKHHDKGNDIGMLCKHLSMIFNSIDFFLSNFTSMINKYIQSR